LKQENLFRKIFCTENSSNEFSCDPKSKPFKLTTLIHK
jgi:hypothetical protein